MIGLALLYTHTARVLQINLKGVYIMSSTLLTCILVAREGHGFVQGNEYTLDHKSFTITNEKGRRWLATVHPTGLVYVYDGSEDDCIAIFEGK